MKLSLIFFCILASSLKLRGQNETAQWICGYHTGRITSQPDTGIFNQFGANIIDFRKSPTEISRKFRTLSMLDCNVSMCDTAGNLLFFSNGAKIFNARDSLIENADSFSPSRIWELTWKSNALDYYGYTQSSFIKQGMIAIPRPSFNNQFYIINFYLSTDSFHFVDGGYRCTAINYSILDMNANNGRGKVTLKEKTILKGNLSFSLTACKHGNGQDWWIAAQDYRGNRVYVLRATKDNIVLQDSSVTYKVRDLYFGSAFSPDGKYYAITGSDSGVSLFKFNRCLGKMEFYKYIKRNKQDSTPLYSSVGFSPNSRFLYSIVGYRLYQYDVEAMNDSLDQVKLNPTDTSPYYQIQQAIDNKLYISSGNGEKYLHVIETPNEKGKACNLKIEGLKLKTWNRGIPHFPNYALGLDTCWHSEIEDIEGSEFSIYPNPTTDKLYIDGLSIRDIQYQITALDGRNLITDKYNQQIDVSLLSNGVYFIDLMSKNGTSVMKKFEIRR
jgi:hypothetical protein